MLIDECDEKVLHNFPFRKILGENIASLALIVLRVKRVQAMQFLRNRVTVVFRSTFNFLQERIKCL